MRPDGVVAFIARRGGVWAVIAQSLDGRKTRVHQLAGIRPQNLSLSSRGRYAAFVGARRGRGDIFVIDLARGAVRALGIERAATKTVAEALAWAPDETALAFVTNSPMVAPRQRRGDFTVQTVRLDGTHVRLIQALPASAAPLPGNPTFVDGIRWSPDGRSLLFEVWQGSEGELRGPVMRPTQMTIVRVAGGTPTSIAHASFPHSVSWSPEGTRFAFADQEGVTVADVSRQRERPLDETFASFFTNISWTRRGIYATHHGDVVLIDPDNGSVRQTPIPLLWPPVATLAAPPDGEYVVLVGGRRLRAYSSEGAHLINRRVSTPTGFTGVGAVAVTADRATGYRTAR